MRIVKFLCCLMGYWMAWTAPAQACAPPGAAQLTLQALMPDVPVVYVPAAQITDRVMASANNEQQFGVLVHQQGGKPSGTVIFTPQVQYQAQFGTEDTDQGRCIWVTALNYQFTDPQPQLWVASELPPGSCIAQEIIAHESRHVAVFENAMLRLQSQADAALRLVLSLPPVQVAYGQEESGYQALYDRINSTMQPLIAQYGAEVTAANNAIDTPGEYLRLSNACDGEAGRYLH